MAFEKIIEYIKSQRENGVSEDVVKKNVIQNGWTLQDYDLALNQNNVKLPLSNRKPNLMIKTYLGLGIFIFCGFIIFLLKISLANYGYSMPENSTFNLLVNIFLEIWGILFVYILPLGIMVLGVWSILYKESAIENPATALTGIHSSPMDLINGTNTYNSVVSLRGNRAVMAGIFYILLGLFLFWGITGVILGILCRSDFCSTFPKFIKFF